MCGPSVESHVCLNLERRAQMITGPSRYRYGVGERTTRRRRCAPRLIGHRRGRRHETWTEHGHSRLFVAVTFGPGRFAKRFIGVDRSYFQGLLVASDHAAFRLRQKMTSAGDGGRRAGRRRHDRVVAAAGDAGRVATIAGCWQRVANVRCRSPVGSGGCEAGHRACGGYCRYRSRRDPVRLPAGIPRLPSRSVVRSSRSSPAHRPDSAGKQVCAAVTTRSPRPIGCSSSPFPAAGRVPPKAGCCGGSPSRGWRRHPHQGCEQLEARG
jgi:hypothetical protein